METRLDRRAFVKGAVVCGGVLAAAGISACSNDSSTSDSGKGSSSDSLNDWNLEADVVVLGFGWGGMGAAVAAAEAGSNVLVLEKMDDNNCGGASCCNEGLIVNRSAETLQNYTYGRWDMERCKVMSKYAEAAANWMKEMDPNLEDTTYGGVPVIRASGLGIQIYTTAFEKIPQYENITIEYETKGTRLIINKDTGEVIGVVAEKDGAELLVKARQGVVIATGGYDANRDMVRSLHYAVFEYASLGGPARTGDGLIMANSVGAQIGNLTQGVEWACHCLRKASEESGTGVQLSANAIGGAIYVNSRGKRFDNELRFLSHNKSTLAHLDFNGESRGVPVKELGYVNLPMWAVWDANMYESATIAETRKRNWANVRGTAPDSDSKKLVDRGWVIKADTLEELAAKMESKNIWNEKVVVDAEGLKATIDTYNAFVGQGVDAEFGRPAENLKAFTTGPYYAAELLPTLLYTINGLVNDINSQVLDWYNNPIARLYAAGDVAQGMSYAPMGFSGVYGQGQIAGGHVSGLESWDVQ